MHHCVKFICAELCHSRCDLHFEYLFQMSSDEYQVTSEIHEAMNRSDMTNPSLATES
jgi:hypothetical protein